MISKKKIVFALGVMISLAVHAQLVDLKKQTEGTSQKIFETKDEALSAAGLDKFNSSENKLIFDAIEKRVGDAKRVFGNAYAGSWIEYDENNKARHIIGVMGDIDSKKAMSFSAEGVGLVVSVRYSYAILEDNQKKIFKYFQELAGNSEPLVYSVGIDDQINKLLVRGRESDLKYIEFRLRNAGFDLNMIKLEVQEGQIQLTGVVVGGTKIMSSNVALNGRALCTAGFNVVIDAIYPGTITSAHCYAPNTLLNQAYFNLGNMTISGSIRGELIGGYFADGWPIGLDAIIFGNTNFVHTQPAKILGANSYRSVKSLALLSIGGTVCSYGGVNGWRCGTQRGVNVMHYYNGKTFYFAEATVCGSAGDSGGPVVSGTDNALGIFAGVASPNAAGTCGPIFGGDVRPNAIFQALAPYLAVYSNVQIRTE